MANYCPECGSPYQRDEAAEIAAAESAAVGEVTDASVRIAEINAKKEIALARIAAGVMDAERDIDAARTEGKAEALEAIVNPPEPEPELTPDPIVIMQDDTDVQADDDMAPPPVEEHDHEPAARRGRSLGIW